MAAGDGADTPQSVSLLFHSSSSTNLCMPCSGSPLSALPIFPNQKPTRSCVVSTQPRCSRPRILRCSGDSRSDGTMVVKSAASHSGGPTRHLAAASECPTVCSCTKARNVFITGGRGLHISQVQPGRIFDAEKSTRTVRIQYTCGVNAW